jgi:sec-independent protein translocase protein TatB
MFDISWTEFLLIGIVALVVIGPKELPGVLRTLGQYTRKVRGMAAEFQNQFQEAMREAEMADLKKSVDDLARDIKGYDPLKSAREDVEAIGRGLNKDFDKKPLDLLKPQESNASESNASEPGASESGVSEPNAASSTAEQAKVEPVVAAAVGVEPVIAEPSTHTPATPAAEPAAQPRAPEPVAPTAPESTERTG